MAVIELKNVSKRYEDLLAVDHVSLEVEEGKILALLGSSGCGKTSTLRLIAGLEVPDSGGVWLNNQPVADERHWLQPEDRRVGMVFQDYALFPHLNVQANIDFALHRLPRAERRQRIDEMLQLVGLAGLGGRYPHQLSGGQQQRVALARALAARPAVVLLDEPFSNLDATLRKSTREEIRRILHSTGMTAIFVTHDQEEALSIADEIAVMYQGRILQRGTPQDVYLRPATRRVAAFVGEANFLPGIAKGWNVNCSLGELPLAEPAKGAVEVMIRPEMIDVKPSLGGAALVESVQFVGYDQLIWLHIEHSEGSVNLRARTRTRTDLQVGTLVDLTIYGRVRAYTV